MFSSTTTSLYKKNELSKKSSLISKTGECKINVYTKLDNGTIIEGTVTIVADGMNFLKCLGIKLYGLFSSDF